MEYRQLKKYGNKFLRVTLIDGTITQGHFLSYKSEADDFNKVEKVNLYEEGEGIKNISTSDIKEIEVVSPSAVGK